MRTVLFIFISIIFCGSCTVIKSKRTANATKAKVKTLSTTPKTVKFIGISHIAKPEFYANIQAEITALKKDGYVLFYEWVDFDLANDITKRKIRKLIGFVPNQAGYESQVEAGKVAQNNEDFLNLVNNLDFNVDVSADDIINEYEKNYGVLKLDSADLTTPIENRLPISEPFTQTLTAILEYRNEFVVQEIKESEHDKIVILYGALHEKGMRKLLKTR